MAQQRGFTPSWLGMAWLILGGLVVVAAGALFLVPARQTGPAPVLIEVPAQPERYAAAEAFPPAGSDLAAGAEAPPSAGRDAGALVDATLGEPDGPDPAPAPVDAVEETPDLPVDTVQDALEAEGDGAVVITLPQSAAARRAAAAVPRPFDPALSRTTDQGISPAVGPDGTRPFDVYRRQEAAVSEGRRVALVVSGLGLDAALTQQAIDLLPATVALSFVPYTKNLEEVVSAAAAKGHEVLIEIPMEAVGVDANVLGPAALMTSRTPAANATRLEWIMSRAPAYPMVTNYLGDVFSADQGAMAPVVQALAAAGVGYMDDTGAAAGVAKAAGVPYGAVALVLTPGARNSFAQLDALSARAPKGAAPIAKIYAGNGGLETAVSWAATAAKAGITLVPVSATLE